MKNTGFFLGLLLILLALALGTWWFFPRRVQERVTLLPGRSIWQLAEDIERQLPGQGEALLLLAEDRAFVGSLNLPLKEREPRQDGVREAWLEGFLMPDTYFVFTDTDAKQLILKVIQQFNKVIDRLQKEKPEVFAELKSELGLGIPEIVILASLIEKETGRADDARRIAGVFLNRLKLKMRLETDPTLMYRPDRVGRPASPNERRDRTNPYNTYHIPALPPGPISSPSEMALRAVLEAESHDYLFFVAKRDGKGSSAFARTLEEHRENIDRYLRN